MHAENKTHENEVSNETQICLNNLQIFTLGNGEQEHFLMKLSKNLEQSFPELNIEALQAELPLLNIEALQAQLPYVSRTYSATYVIWNSI